MRKHPVRKKPKIHRLNNKALKGRKKGGPSVSYTNLNYHIIFSTKNHKPYLNDSEMKRVFEYIGGITRNQKATLLSAGGTSNHVHIAVRLHPQLSIAEYTRVLKTNCSKWIHETLTKDFAWQEGYSAFSVSQSVVGKVIDYIRGQKEHHKRLSFKEELQSFLKRHNIDFNEQYL